MNAVEIAGKQLGPRVFVIAEIGNNHNGEIDLAERLIDAAAEAGADQIGDPEFGFADPSAGRTLATRAALADARRRADDAAAVVGLRITGVRSVNLDPDSDGDFGEQNSSGAAGGSDDSAKAPTQVSPGTRDFTERVRVIYTVAPAT